MFGTLRYSALEDDAEFVGRTYDSLVGPKDGVRYVACDRCRSKKLRCSGQDDGCDRCKRYSSVCVYSVDAKAKHARRRKNLKGSNNSASDPPWGEASSDVQPTSGKETNSTPKAREQGERPVSATEQVRHTGNVMPDMTDMFTASNSPNGSLFDDFLLTDEETYGFLPESSGQSVYGYRNASNIPGQTDPEGIFPNRLFDLDHVDSMSTDPTPSERCMANASMGPTLDVEVSQYRRGNMIPLSSQSHSQNDTEANGLTASGQNLDLSTLGQVQQHRQTNQESGTPQAAISVEKAHAECQCLETVGILFEKLDKKSNTEELASLDSILATHKEALGRCGSVLKCATCVTRPEYILLLVLITENLASLCESMVSKYLDEAHCQCGDALPRHGQVAGPGVFVGKYEIDAEEWNSLIRGLIGIQLRNLRTLLQRIASSPGIRPGPGASQRAKLQATWERVARLVKRLRQPGSRAPTSIEMVTARRMMGQRDGTSGASRQR